jgi:hypothetical protein
MLRSATFVAQSAGRRKPRAPARSRELRARRKSDGSRQLRSMYIAMLHKARNCSRSTSSYRQDTQSSCPLQSVQCAVPVEAVSSQHNPEFIQIGCLAPYCHSARKVIGMAPIKWRVVDEQRHISRSGCIAQFAEDVDLVRRSINDIPCRFLCMPHAESVVMLGCEGDVSHAGRFSHVDPQSCIEFARIESGSNGCVILKQQSIVVQNPLSSAWSVKSGASVVHYASNQIVTSPDLISCKPPSE